MEALRPGAGSCNWLTALDRTPDAARALRDRGSPHIDPTATRFTFEKMLSFIDRLHADALADDGAARDRRRHARNLSHALASSS